MDDLMGMLDKIMADPQQMQQISSLAESLGLHPTEEAADAPPKAAKQLSEIFSGSDYTTLLPLMQKLQNSSDDKYITFLRALQPILSDERKPKVDTAITRLKTISFLPYLEESGVLPENNLLHNISSLLKGVFL